mmetsp:Transcript_4292/g.9261  ORF Transcript_4292/g.9261 Transcript_4292/m.9261 type:complete len:653 (-) Transcript_4292:611-2569(-)
MDFIKDLNIDKVRNLAEDAFNQAKPKTDVEARVYEVLSHKNWGASSTLMNEIAQDTFDYERFLIVTKLMWEAIETPRPAAWRVIFKGLTLLEHLVKNGSERCVDDARNHSHLLRSLDRFNYYEGTVDRGLGVREKSKQLVEMLGDDERIREERMKARQLKQKFAGRGTTATSGAGSGAGGASRYAGYGNSDAGWSTSGGSTGYGESGIGSSSGADRGYAGRYGESGVDSIRSAKSPARATPAATVVSDMQKKEKKASSSAKVKKVKKKEKPVAAPAPAPEIDLFSFDTAPTEPAKSTNDEFDAFQTATPADANDDFGDFQQIAPSSAVEFDAFGSAPPPATQPAAFDAFGISTSQPMNAMQQSQQMGGNQVGGNIATMNNAFGKMGLSSAPAPVVAAAPAADDGDDFGDFEGADTSTSKAAETSSDPLSKLISLDGLTKNTKKEDKPKESIGEKMAFSSVDGMSGGLSMGMSQPVMGSGVTGDVGAKNISLMAPPMGGNQMMGGQHQQGMMQNRMMGGQQLQGMMQNQMMGGQPQQQQQRMIQNSMMGGMQGGMNGGVHNQMMNNQMMGGGSMQGMGGGMGFQGGIGMQQGNNMMGGGGNMINQGNAMMGGQQGGTMGGNDNYMMNQGNMQGNMGGMNNNMMGGQSQFGQFR